MAGEYGSGSHSAEAEQELAVLILTLNEAKHITDCIASVRWADRVIVFDAYSDDNTVELAREAGAEVILSEFENFSQQRNAALDSVTANWIFFVDADERATTELAAEVRDVINTRSEAGWYVPRHNYIFGRLTMGAGWYPDYQLRLFRQGFVRYERAVHEIASVDGDIGYLENVLLHHNYEDLLQFHRKQRRYTDYDALILMREGIRPSVYTPFTQMVRQFWWRFVTLRGIQDGIHGLRLSLLMAYYEWIKYRKLVQLYENQTTAVPGP